MLAKHANILAMVSEAEKARKRHMKNKKDKTLCASDTSLFLEELRLHFRKDLYCSQLEQCMKMFHCLSH